MQKDPLGGFIRHKDERKQLLEEQRSEVSRETLKEIIASKITTTMIGAISDVEKIFGFLWGQDKKTGLTRSESQMRDLKNDLRAEILNRGNDQLRAAMQEIDQYDVKFRKYHYVFKTPNTDNGNKGI